MTGMGSTASFPGKVPSHIRRSAYRDAVTNLVGGRHGPELSLMRGDVVVIGSGPIGAVIARRFAEGGRVVTMLEAGPAISDPPGSHVRNQTRFQRDPDYFFAGLADKFTYFDAAAPPAGLPGASTTAVVGGQGALWTNNCPRPSTFEQWAAMPAPE
jgi:choline dehydrogenase-like flavoprotein